MLVHKKTGRLLAMNGEYIYSHQDNSTDLAKRVEYVVHLLDLYLIQREIFLIKLPKKIFFFGGGLVSKNVETGI